MKLTMDERLKHRLVGLAVILSIGVIFAPAILKKSNEHFDEKNTISINLPLKPVLSKIDVPNEKTMLAKVSPASVVLPTIPAIKVNPIAKAEPLSPSVNKFKAVRVAASKPALIKQPSTLNSIAMKTVSAVKPSLTKSGYAVQLAMFIEQENAVALVNRLKKKGYRDASYTQVKNKKGSVYKVFVGKAIKKQDAMDIQKNIASAMQLKGFIVPTEIS